VQWSQAWALRDPSRRDPLYKEGKLVKVNLSTYNLWSRVLEGHKGGHDTSYYIQGGA
jgi:hypothetical protein